MRASSSTNTWPLSQVPLTSMTSAARATRREDDVVVGEDDMALESQLAWMLDLNDISQVTLEFGGNVTGSALRLNGG